MQRWEVSERLTIGEDVTDRAIYETVRGPLMRFASSLVGRDQAGDLVSEVILETLKNRTLSSLDNPQAYLMRAILNRARSARRRFNREQAHSMREAPAVGHDPTAGLATQTDVKKAVAALPVQQRAAIYLVYWVGYEPSEAAELLGVQPATLRRYLYLARLKLRRFLDE